MTSRADDRLAIPARVLSSTQLELLAEHGEEYTAEVGEKLYQIGDATYPFIAVLEGEVTVSMARGTRSRGTWRRAFSGRSTF